MSIEKESPRPPILNDPPKASAANFIIEDKEDRTLLLNLLSRATRYYLADEEKLGKMITAIITFFHIEFIVLLIFLVHYNRYSGPYLDGSFYLIYTDILITFIDYMTMFRTQLYFVD